MSWQRSHTIADRFFGSLVYLLPIADAYYFGSYIFQQAPIVQELYLPLLPLMFIYSFNLGSFISGKFIVFIAIYLAVVNNPKISRFIRFNALQAILIGIILSLCGIVLRYVLAPIVGDGTVNQVLMNLIFLGAIGASIYAIVMSVMGKYAEFTKISEAARMTVDRY